MGIECKNCNIVLGGLEEWNKVTLRGLYEDYVSERNDLKEDISTKIDLYICPRCGAVFTDWNKHNF